MKRKLIAFAWVLALSGCANDADEDYADRSVDELYNEASDYYEKGSYTKAAKTFIEIERQHPYSDWALRAQLRAGEAYYQSKKYEDAIETFNVFIQLHPAHPDVPYAHYMVGMCYYEQIPTIERDQQVTEMAMKSFQTIIKRYPGTSYAKDAGMKMDLINDQIAGKEMEV
ncbi:MAG: outer membrane protein assembly factor BamD, partial [Alphaproteobacteria bacterium]